MTWLKPFKPLVPWLGIDPHLAPFHLGSYSMSHPKHQELTEPPNTLSLMLGGGVQQSPLQPHMHYLTLHHREEDLLHDAAGWRDGGLDVADDNANGHTRQLVAEVGVPAHQLNQFSANCLGHRGHQATGFCWQWLHPSCLLILQAEVAEGIQACRGGRGSFLYLRSLLPIYIVGPLGPPFSWWGWGSPLGLGRFAGILWGSPITGMGYRAAVQIACDRGMDTPAWDRGWSVGRTGGGCWETGLGYRRSSVQGIQGCCAYRGGTRSWPRNNFNSIWKGIIKHALATASKEKKKSKLL